MHKIKVAKSPAKRGRRRAPRQLGLRAYGKRGGYRDEAGRPRGRSGHYVPHVRRARVTRHDAVHVTLRVVEGVPSLRRPRPSDWIERIFKAEKRRKGFRLIHYSIRPNHLHLVCEAEGTMALSRGIQRIASRMARALNRLFRRRHRLFADRFHNRVIKTPRDMRNTLAYVLLNEHKDRAARGHTVHGVDPFSSGMHFDGWKNVGPVVPWPDEPPPPVTEARSWILSKGWRRRGLIHTQERAPTSCS